MDDFEKERLAVKVYRLAEITNSDWKIVMPRYNQQLKEWSIFPTIFWHVLALSGIAAIFLDWFYPWFHPWFAIIGVLALFITGEHFAKRSGEVEGFQTGYEWGKQDGVCKALDIKESEKLDLLRLARKVIVEFKVGSGDPDLEVGMKSREGPEDT
jgi:hypothetical protein